MPTVAKAKPKPKPRAAANAALAELSDAPRLTTYRGVALTLPAKLPATYALDMAEVQASTGTNDLGPTYRLFVGILGQEQWRKVRDKIAADGVPMDDISDVLEGLFEAISAPYNVEPGESPASATS